MAAAPDPNEVLCSTNEKVNFQRLARLLICGGTSLLGKIFAAKCLPNQLPTKLSDPATKEPAESSKTDQTTKGTVFTLLLGCIASHQNFDFTLPFSLLGTICGLVRIAKGLDALPESTDHSLTKKKP